MLKEFNVKRIQFVEGINMNDVASLLCIYESLGKGQEQKYLLCIRF